MGGRNFFVTGLVVFSLLFISLPAYAVPITQMFGGYLGDVSPNSNSYGLATGAISWTVTYDNAITGDQFVSSFDFCLPNNEYYHIDDFPDYGKPKVRLEGENITKVWFSSLNFSDLGTGLPTLMSAEMEDSFTLMGADGFMGSGTLNFSPAPAPVPEPGAIWLLSPGLAFLAVFRKRIRQA